MRMLKDIKVRARKERAGFIGLGIRGKGEVEAFQLPTELAEKLGANVMELRVYAAFVRPDAAVGAWYENAYARPGKSKITYCIGDGEYVRWHDAKGFDPLVRNYKPVRPFKEIAIDGQQVVLSPAMKMSCSGSGDPIWQQCKACKRQIAVRVYVRDENGDVIGNGYYEVRTSSLGAYHGTYGFLVELDREIAGRMPLTDVPLLLKRVSVKRNMGDKGIREGWDLQFSEEDPNFIRNIGSYVSAPSGPEPFDAETGEIEDIFDLADDNSEQEHPANLDRVEAANFFLDEDGVLNPFTSMASWKMQDIEQWALDTDWRPDEKILEQCANVTMPFGQVKVGDETIDLGGINMWAVYQDEAARRYIGFLSAGFDPADSRYPGTTDEKWQLKRVAIYIRVASHVLGDLEASIEQELPGEGEEPAYSMVGDFDKDVVIKYAKEVFKLPPTDIPVALGCEDWNGVMAAWPGKKSLQDAQKAIAGYAVQTQKGV